ncbi:MAG TPA: DUF4350 domain-containing protein [Chitinophagaceae bacterium]|nr:DUF4350 domain-containing protein [Chitinophagaceae bacterium]
MKGYKRFIFSFAVLLAIYIVAEYNRPRPLDWKVTLAKDDKQPYGGYIVYQQLKTIFPQAAISSFRTPVYDQVNNFSDSNTAYLLIEPGAEIQQAEIDDLLNYAVIGNYVFIAAEHFSKALMDTLHFETEHRFDIPGKDSVTINFVNPALHMASDIGFTPMTLNGYFKKMDTLHSIALGNNQKNDINFIKIPYGDGAFFVHTAPLSFSNYFMLTRDNADYTATALSYLPKNIKAVYWDEYYKLGRGGASTPLRFLLSNTWFRWALRLALVTVLLFVLFESKRKQRVIPIIVPPRNSTLDFVETVGSVYFNQRDNKNIALKKINYFMEFVRSQFYLPTTQLNEEFARLLAKKAGVAESQAIELVQLIEDIHNNSSINDDALMQLNQQIDLFYEKVK